MQSHSTSLWRECNPALHSQRTKHLDFIRLQKFRFPHFLSATLAQWASRQPLAPWPECRPTALFCVSSHSLSPLFPVFFTANLSSKGKTPPRSYKRFRRRGLWAAFPKIRSQTSICWWSVSVSSPAASCGLCRNCSWMLFSCALLRCTFSPAQPPSPETTEKKNAWG